MKQPNNKTMGEVGYLDAFATHERCALSKTCWGRKRLMYLIVYGSAEQGVKARKQIKGELAAGGATRRVSRGEFREEAKTLG